MTPNTNCTHKRVTHLHGTRVCYVLDKCRCNDCRAIAASYERDRARRKVYETTTPGAIPTLVDAEPVRAHIAHLTAQGMGWKRIAKHAGVTISVVSTLLYGKYPDRPGHPEHRPPNRKLNQPIAAALLAVNLDLAPGAPIDGTGTRRRLQALIRLGWSQSTLAARLGIVGTNLGKTIHGVHPKVYLATAQAVRDLYEELWDTPPTPANRYERGAVVRAIRYAEAHDWPPPLAWDDEALDDPTARPWTDEAPTIASRATRRHWHPEDVEFLLDDGLHPAIVAKRVGVRLDTLTLTLRRDGRDDLADRLNAKNFENRPATTRTHRRGTAA